MSISIVTVALNAAADLPLTIESGLGQVGDDIEYIVVDGGSWDETGTLLKRYAHDLDAIVHVEDAGIYYAMNHAVQHCTKDYILFLNAGDRLYAADVLQSIREQMDRQPDIVFGDHVYVDGRREILKRAARFEQTAAALRAGQLTHQWHSRIPGHQATLTSRALLRAMPYDTRYRICADHDFLFRAFQRGATFQYVDEIVSHYIGGGFSAMQSDLCRREWNHVYRKFSDRPRAVDAFIYPDGSSPFLPFTDRTGTRMHGFFLPEGPFPDLGIPWRICWCSGEGFGLLTPVEADARAVTLAGYNTLTGQTLDAYHGDTQVGSVVVPLGTFEVTMAFEAEVPAGSRIHFVPQRFLKHPAPDNRVVSIALAFSEFQLIAATPVDALSPGQQLSFIGSHGDQVTQYLGRGWSGLEDTHVWSLGQRSDLILRAVPDVRELVLAIGYNPYVPVDNRVLKIEINDVAAGEVELRDHPTPVSIPTAHPAWRTGRNNQVTLRPKQAMTPPHEGRLLGVLLSTIEAR